MTELLARPDDVAHCDVVGEARYRLGAALGRGRRSVVHLATDKRLQRTVAVRLCVGPIPPDDLVAAATVWVPGTARVFDAGVEVDGSGSPRTYLVRELVHGLTWRELAGVVECRPATIAGVAAGVATTLASLHRTGACHGSIHGGNVLVRDVGVSEQWQTDAAGNTVLTDLGLGRPSDESSPAHDVRDLGYTLLEILTGRRVVGSRTARAAVEALRRRGTVASRDRAVWTSTLDALTDSTAPVDAVEAAAALRALAAI